MQRFSVSSLIAVCMLALAGLCARPLPAQIDTGGVTGTVKDSSGAVVAGAKITLTNDGTGVSIRTDSTSTGTYFFGGLLPASYTLEAQSGGVQELHRSRTRHSRSAGSDPRYSSGSGQRAATGHSNRRRTPAAG